MPGVETDTRHLRVKHRKLHITQRTRVYVITVYLHVVPNGMPAIFKSMKLYNNNQINSCIFKQNSRSDEKLSLPESLVNVPFFQSLLLANSGNGHAVLMRQTSIEIQHFCRVLICHAPPQHAQCIGGHPISCCLLGVIMKGKITAI